MVSSYVVEFADEKGAVTIVSRTDDFAKAKRTAKKKSGEKDMAFELVYVVAKDSNDDSVGQMVYTNGYEDRGSRDGIMV